jgi:hypothetical protein
MKPIIGLSIVSFLSIIQSELTVSFNRKGTTASRSPDVAQRNPGTRDFRHELKNHLSPFGAGMIEHIAKSGGGSTDRNTEPPHKFLARQVLGR